MIRVNVLSVGKINKAYFKDAIAEYSKRIGGYASFDIIEVPEGKNDRDIESESNSLIKLMHGYNILLDVSGTTLSSEEISLKIDNLASNGKTPINFIIGGSRGVSDKLKALCDFRLSFGRVTYPHQLMRLILVEQIYRAFTILKNTGYHK